MPTMPMVAVRAAMRDCRSLVRSRVVVILIGRRGWMVGKSRPVQILTRGKGARGGLEEVGDTLVRRAVGGGAERMQTYTIIPVRKSRSRWCGGSFTESLAGKGKRR